MNREKFAWVFIILLISLIVGTLYYRNKSVNVMQTAPNESVIQHATSSAEVSDFKTGYIKNISHQNGVLFLTIHAILFTRDSNALDGYNITDLKEEKTFQATSSTTITLTSDVLTQLLAKGIVKDDSQDYVPEKTVLFNDLVLSFEAKGYSWNDALLMNAPYYFSFTNGIVNTIKQQYIP